MDYLKTLAATAIISLHFSAAANAHDPSPPTPPDRDRSSDECRELEKALALDFLNGVLGIAEDPSPRGQERKAQRMLKGFVDGLEEIVLNRNC